MQNLEFIRVSRNLKEHAERFQAKLARWNDFRENHTLRRECLALAARSLHFVRLKLGFLRRMAPNQSSNAEMQNCENLRQRFEAQIVMLQSFESA